MNGKARWIVEDLGRASARLAEALAGKNDSDLLRAGCIQYYEFCFELAWKAIKLVAEAEGQRCESPKSCLKTAFALGWIDDETLWLEMLDARNRMSHTYRPEQALRVYDRLPAFAAAFRGLLDHLKLTQ